MQRPKARLDAEALWGYAVRALSGRAHSQGELRQKLRRKAAHAPDVDAVLARLKEYGYLNDLKFAEMLATSRMENQGFGRARVTRELRQRRVAPSLADQVTARVFADTDEIAMIQAFLSRKYRNVVLSEFLKERRNLASAYRRLRMAGFGSGNVIRVLKGFTEEAEILESLDTEHTEPGADR
jgi:regulatory protein